MKKTFAILTVAMLAPISSSFAAEFSDWAIADRISVTTSRTHIYIDTVPNPAMCGLTDAIVIPDSSGNYEAMTAAAMSAVAGGFELRMQIDEVNCSASRPIALFVSLRR